MKPRMLFLDDEDWRHKLADERYASRFDVTHARTVNQFRRDLEFGEFQAVSLDHDLGTVLTGMSAARDLCALSSGKRPNVVIVHSWNVPAADAMVVELERSGYRVIRKPFEAPKGSELST